MSNFPMTKTKTKNEDEMFATALTVHQYWLQFGKTGYESYARFSRDEVSCYDHSGNTSVRRLTGHVQFSDDDGNGDDGSMLLEGALRLRQVFLDSFRGLTSHDRFSRDEMFATALTVHQYWL